MTSRFPQPCIVANCPNLVPPFTKGSRCKAHAREYERTRSAERDRKRGGYRERFGPGWSTIRTKVIARDRGICQICGEDGATTADHIVSRRDGGDSSMDNLQAAHVSCNARKGASGSTGSTG